MKRILVAGASVYGLENISDDSMLFSWLHALKKHVDLEVTMMARHIPNYLEPYTIDSFIRNLDFDSKADSQGKRFRGFNIGDETSHLNAIYKCMDTCDLLIIGGDPFIEITLSPYRGILSYIEMLILLAKFTNTPVLLHGIHFGRPPVSELGVSKMLFCLDNANAVTTRSLEALDKLSEFSEFQQERLGILHTDDAYGLGLATYGASPDSKLVSRLKDWTEKERNSGYRIAIITMRTLYWVWNKENRERFFNEMSLFLRFMYENENTKFIFLPHCTYNSDDIWEDDRSGHREIVKRIDPACFFAVDQRVEVEEILPIFALTDFAVGNRRHTGIFSGLNHKPFVLFGEPLHVSPVYEDYKISRDIFVDYEDLDSQTLIAAYQKIFSIDDLAQRITEGNSRMREVFENGIQEIVNLINR